MGTGLVDTTVIDALTDDTGAGTDGTILDKAWFESLDEGQLITCTNWRITSAGVGFLGDTSNGNMTRGWTINQGAADDEAFCVKSSDIAHGTTGITETDTYFLITKKIASTGGALLTGLSEGIGQAAIELRGISVGDDTSKTTGGKAPCSVDAYAQSGTGAAAPGSNANIWTARAGAATRFLVDVEGDFHYDGADGGAYDAYDDAMMLRALTCVSAGSGVIRNQFDEMIAYNEQALIDAGLLGAPVEEGGLVNGAQVQRFLMGAVWQLYSEVKELRAQRRGLVSRVAGWLSRT